MLRLHWRSFLPGASRPRAGTGTEPMGMKNGELMASNRARVRRERLQRDLRIAGSLLADAVALEQHFASLRSRKPGPRGLSQWQMCRRALRPLVEDYCRALSRYEVALRTGACARYRAGH